MIDEGELAVAAAAVRALPVVTAVYTSRPALQLLGAELAGVLLHDRPHSPVTAEEGDDGVLQVHATVGITDGTPAPACGLAVADTIRDRLDAAHAGARHITVRISTIG